MIYHTMGVVSAPVSPATVVQKSQHQEYEPMPTTVSAIPGVPSGLVHLVMFVASWHHFNTQHHRGMSKGSFFP